MLVHETMLEGRLVRPRPRHGHISAVPNCSMHATESTSTAVEAGSSLLSPSTSPAAGSIPPPSRSRPAPSFSLSLPCGRLEWERRGKIASRKAVCLHCLSSLLEDLPRVNSGDRRGKIGLSVLVGLSLVVSIMQCWINVFVVSLGRKSKTPWSLHCMRAAFGLCVFSWVKCTATKYHIECKKEK
jgi:hypothetical protein